MSADATLTVDRRRPSGPSAVLRKGWSLVRWIFLAALAVSAIFPLLFLVATAVRTTTDYKQDPGGLPAHFTFSNIEEAFSVVHLATLTLNSLLVVVPAVALLTVLACLASYALVHFQFPFRNFSLLVVVLLMALPQMAILIPVFKLIVEVHLLNQRLGLILVYTALNLPFSTYLLASFMRSVPTELLNSARIDGAGPLRTLWSIVLPLIRPGLLTLVTLNFLILWNEFLFSLVILQKESSRTIMVGIAQFQGVRQPNFGLVATGLLISMVPPLLIFIFFQRDLARGLTAGAVK
jgi:ABC-type glycerol-3-phosphate transport system permease component